jgi:hypothetical protein
MAARAGALDAREVWLRRRAAGLREEPSEEAMAGSLLIAEDGWNLAQLRAATEAIAKMISGGGG